MNQIVPWKPYTEGQEIHGFLELPSSQIQPHQNYYHSSYGPLQSYKGKGSGCNGIENLIFDIGISSLAFGLTSVFLNWIITLIGTVLSVLIHKFITTPTHVISAIAGGAGTNTTTTGMETVLKTLEMVLVGMEAGGMVPAAHRDQLISVTAKGLALTSLFLAATTVFSDLWIHDLDTLFGRQGAKFIHSYGCSNPFNTDALVGKIHEWLT